HAFPQSFFNHDEPPKSDIHALFPSDSDINTERSNHAYGVVTNPSYTDIYGNKDVNGMFATFEPADVDKGRAARAILYMDIRYEGENGDYNLSVTNTYPTGTGGLSMAYLNTLLEWHRLYPPTAFERGRNQKAYNYQGNANPFV